MPSIKINGRDIEVEEGLTVLQACEEAGVEIPRFCYHERLSIAGNCRMCLVEMEPSPKPIASCAMPINDGMVIHTDTDLVKKAREGVMEFLLINHPLDCPICDQGGECDLQDQAMGYGLDKSRFLESKRAVKNKYLGPLVSTIMTRCIHCTRCIRFAQEIAGVPELGATGRGENMEVGTYVEKALSSELSGNLVDLCPVGALTSKPYEFKARSWELVKTQSIDVFDAMGSNIRIDSRGSEVMRVLPRINNSINEEWISDKTRHACDGLSRQRLDRPYVRRNGKLEEESWDVVLSVIAEKMNNTSPKRMAAIAGDLVDCESLVSLKDLMQTLGCNNLDCRQDSGAFGNPRSSYIFNSGIKGIDRADVILLIGCNPRWEAPVLNARIRKQYLNGAIIGVIGPEFDLTFPFEHLSPDLKEIKNMLEHPSEFGDKLAKARSPMLILGSGALAREDGEAILGAARDLAERFNIVNSKWNGFNVLQRAASRVGGIDLGFVPKTNKDLGTREILRAAEKKEIDVIYLLGSDEIEMDRLGDAFVIYQGHHGDAGAHRADAILPGAAYTEKNGTYVNLEGRCQRALRAVFPPGEAKEDWAILRALSERIGKKLPFDNLLQVRERMSEVNPIFSSVNKLSEASWGKFGSGGEIKDGEFIQPIENFYMTDVISRASATMAECTEVALAKKEKAA